MTRASRLKVGQRVKVIRYTSVEFYGVITRIDPILSANGKRAIGYWFVIRFEDTVAYFCTKGERGLFTNRDIEAA